MTAVLRMKRFANRLRTGWPVLLFLPVALILRLVRPIVLIRFSPICANRIGALTIDSSFFLATRRESRLWPLEKRWFFFVGQTCNGYWSRMVEDKLFVRPWVRYLFRASELLPGHQQYVVPGTKRGRDPDGYFRQAREVFQIPAADNRLAERWMERRGWQKGVPFVCLLVRDSKYLMTQEQGMDPEKVREKWSYHDYRDSDIDTYDEAIRFLLNEGYWVVRMGKAAHKQCPVKDPRVIDYPFVEEQDDLLDIWLSLNCSLFFSTGTGIDIMPTIYGRPTSIFVNTNPLPLLHSWHHMTWTPKHLIWKASNRYLTLREHIRFNLVRQEDYESQGIRLVDLTSAEIRDSVAEHCERLKGIWVDTEDDLRRQKLFWDILREDPQFHLRHHWIHPEARVGAHYLRKMGDAFFD